MAPSRDASSPRAGMRSMRTGLVGGKGIRVAVGVGAIVFVGAAVSFGLAVSVGATVSVGSTVSLGAAVSLGCAVSAGSIVSVALGGAVLGISVPGTSVLGFLVGDGVLQAATMLVMSEKAR